MSVFSSFTHLDLRSGRSVRLPLTLEPEKQVDTLPLMLLSQRAGRPVTWAAGMTLFTDLTLSGHGVATIMLSAAYAMHNGQIKKDQTVYSMAVAVSPRMRMQGKAWSTILNLFLHAMLQGDNDFSAFGDIPSECPWTAGFSWPCTATLSEKGNLNLLKYARIAAAAVVNHCRDVYVTDVAKDGSPDEESPDSWASPS